MGSRRSTSGSPRRGTAVSGNALAREYENTKGRIISSLFEKRDEDGSLVETYITHVRILETSQTPSSPSIPGDFDPDNVKHRFIIVAVKKNGRVRVLKSRENANGTFSVGKAWNLDDLESIEESQGSGFIITLVKPYYWLAHSLREKTVFITSLVKIYKKYTGGRTPALIGFSSDVLGNLGIHESPQQSLSRSPPPRLQRTPPPIYPPARASTGSTNENSDEVFGEESSRLMDSIEESLGATSKADPDVNLASPFLDRGSSSSFFEQYKDVQLSELDSVFDDEAFESRDPAKDLITQLQDRKNRLEEEDIETMLRTCNQIDDLGKLVDQAIAECDDMDNILTFYAIEMGSKNGDVAGIEAQNEYLQLQFRNKSRLRKQLLEVLDTNGRRR